MMRKLAIFTLPVLALSMSACGGSSKKENPDLVSSAGDMANGQDLATNNNPDMNGFPAAPTLGAQIDRLGRPGVNTALTDPFWDDGTQTAAQHHMKQDAYNAVSDPTMWATSMPDGTNTTLTLFEGALGAYDSLNGTGNGTQANDGCGDQLAFGALTGLAGYASLATVLVDDELYVNTASSTCSVYLGVEANALGVTNTDCGGRTPNARVIDITYTALAVGSAVTDTTNGCITSTQTCAVSNGVLSDGDGSANQASDTAFPFLGAPN